ncbi:Protein saf4 [Paecilomyces lecythidis]
MGRYVPPDQEGLTTGNKLAGKHALGARARHLRTTGALVVRFEMPFAVWCTTCQPEAIIGQGVRFNAEKKKVGNYYSTPIYSFRMKHTACGGWIEIRTDPKNTAYVVTEGGRKRDTGEDKFTGEPGEIRIRLGGEKGAEQEEDSFAKLEGKVEDKRRAMTESSRILELQKRQARDWEDPYEKSRKLRRTFRTERKELQKAEGVREALKDKMSLGIEIVDETEEDRMRAGMVDFGAIPDPSHATRTKPMFAIASPPHARNPKSTDQGKKGRKLKAADVVAERKALLRNELSGNTRAAVDPFLTGESVWQPEIKKRKAAKQTSDGGSMESPVKVTPANEKAVSETPAERQSAVPALVDYGSDSD